MFSRCLSFIQPDLHRSEQNTESTTISAHYHLVRSWIYDISITHLWHYNTVSLTWSVRSLAYLPLQIAWASRVVCVQLHSETTHTLLVPRDFASCSPWLPTGKGSSGVNNDSGYRLSIPFRLSPGTSCCNSKARFAWALAKQTNKTSVHASVGKATKYPKSKVISSAMRMI